MADDIEEIIALIDDPFTCSQLQALHFPQLGAILHEAILRQARHSDLLRDATEADEHLETLLCALYALSLPAPHDFDTIWAEVCTQHADWENLVPIKLWRRNWALELASNTALSDACTTLCDGEAPSISHLETVVTAWKGPYELSQSLAFRKHLIAVINAQVMRQKTTLHRVDFPNALLYLYACHA